MTREEVEGIFKRERLSVRVIMELASNEAINRAVEDGFGISMISANVVKREIEAGLLNRTNTHEAARIRARANEHR